MQDLPEGVLPVAHQEPPAGSPAEKHAIQVRAVPVFLRVQGEIRARFLGLVQPN